MRAAALLALGACLPAAWTVAGGTAAVPTIRLNNGVQMPVLAYGANLYPEAVCRQATAWALQAGFRFIWSSEIIGEPCQRAQRVAIDASGIPRAEVFLAGTVNTKDCSGPADCYQKTKDGAEKQFAVLSDAQLDMLMLDYPSSTGCEGISGQWKAFEELYAAKRVRTIAVSNFGAEELQCITGTPSATVPSVNQLRFNVAGNGQDTAVADDGALGVVLQAYSPLGTGSVLSDPTLIAIGQAHGKTAAQVALKWILQKGAAVNLASTKLLHLQEDTQLFDFTLSDAEMAQLGAAHGGAAAATATAPATAPMSKVAIPGPGAGGLLRRQRAAGRFAGMVTASLAAVLALAGAAAMAAVAARMGFWARLCASGGRRLPGGPGLGVSTELLGGPHE